MRARQAVSGLTLEASALASIRRAGGWLHGIPSSGVGVFTDSAGTIPATAVGDVLGRVNDRAGVNHATQATQASKPIIGTLANGRRAIRFDGANDFLSLPPAAVFNAHADHWAVAAFVKMGGDGLGQVLCGSSNTSNNNSLACQVFLDTTNTVRAIWRTDAGTSSTVSTVGTVTIGSPTVVTAQRTSNIGTLRLNGASVGTPQTLPTSGITVNTANVGISVRPVNASPLNGFAVVAAGNGTLQDADRSIIERYLAQQIGASLGA